MIVQFSEDSYPAIPKKLIIALFWFITLILTISLIILITKSRNWPIMWDAARVHYVCWSITEGAVPYRDIFDTDFPGTYLIHLAVFKFLGEGNGAWRIFDISCLVIIWALAIAYLRPFGILSAVLGPALFSCYHLYNGPLFTGQRDYILIIFIFASTYSIARYTENNLRVRYLLLAGLLLGAAVSVKPYTGILTVIFLTIILFYSFRSRVRWWLHAALFSAFCSLIPVILIFWLWLIGGLNSFFDVLFNYLLPFYSKFNYKPLRHALLQHFLGLPIILPIGLVCILSLISMLLQKKLLNRRLLLCVGILYGVIHFISQGHNDYQLYPAMFFMFLSAASWLLLLQAANLRVIYGIMLILLLYLNIGTAYQTVMNVIQSPPHHIIAFKCTEDLIADLQGKVPATETVQVMDFMSGAIHALFVLRYHEPTRFIYDFHFFHDLSHPYIKKLKKEFLEALKHNPPLYFVITAISWPIEGYGRLQTFPELINWIERNYSFEFERTYYRLYKRSSK